jgi:hypothetical protein
VNGKYVRLTDCGMIEAMGFCGEGAGDFGQGQSRKGLRLKEYSASYQDQGSHEDRNNDKSHVNVARRWDTRGLPKVIRNHDYKLGKKLQNYTQSKNQYDNIECQHDNG